MTSERASAARPAGGLGAAIAGGVIGVGADRGASDLRRAARSQQPIVRQGTARRSANPGRHRRRACATRNMRRSSRLIARRSKRPFASSWKGAAKPEVTLVEFFDYACPYCKASNPSVDRLMQEDKGLRVVYRELPILGPDSVAAAACRLKPRRPAASRSSTTPCGPPAGPPPTPSPCGRSGGPRPDAAQRSRKRSRAQAQLPLAGQSRRDRHALVRGRRQGDERRGRLRRAEEGDRPSPRKELKSTADQAGNTLIPVRRATWLKYASRPPQIE